MASSTILGTGAALPGRVVTNAHLEHLVETSDEWITARTGIKERRILDAGRVTSDLAAEAGEAACQAARIKPAALDCIIVSTFTPDRPLPSTAVYVQHKLGAAPCPAFDLNAACAGFLYGVALADSLVRTGDFRRILVIGVEILSRVANWQDRATCVLYGDGAGAVIIGSVDPAPDKISDCRGILSIDLGADGAGAEHLLIPAGGTARPASAETVANALHTVHMNGRTVYSDAVRGIGVTCQATLAHNNIAMADLDLVVMHQANLRIIEAVCERYALPLDRCVVNIQRFGNTSSASIPIALDEAVRCGRLVPGMLVLLCAFGAGYAWGSALLRW